MNVGIISKKIMTARQGRSLQLLVVRGPGVFGVTPDGLVWWRRARGGVGGGAPGAKASSVWDETSLRRHPPFLALKSEESSKLLTGQSSSSWPLPSTTGLSHREGWHLQGQGRSQVCPPHSTTRAVWQGRSPLRLHILPPKPRQKARVVPWGLSPTDQPEKAPALPRCHLLLPLPRVL